MGKSSRSRKENVASGRCDLECGHSNYIHCKQGGRCGVPGAVPNVTACTNISQAGLAKRVYQSVTFL